MTVRFITEPPRSEPHAMTRRPSTRMLGEDGQMSQANADAGHSAFLLLTPEERAPARYFVRPLMRCDSRRRSFVVLPLIYPRRMTAPYSPIYRDWDVDLLHIANKDFLVVDLHPYASRRRCHRAQEQRALNMTHFRGTGPPSATGQPNSNDLALLRSLLRVRCSTLQVMPGSFLGPPPPF